MDSRKVVSNDGQPDRGALLPAKEQCASVGLIAGLHPVRAVEFQAEKPIWSPVIERDGVWVPGVGGGGSFTQPPLGGGSWGA